MSHADQPKAGTFTTNFASVAAGDVRVAGLPMGSAGSFGAPRAGLSSMPGQFAVGPDTARLLREVTRHAMMPVLLAAA